MSKWKKLLSFLLCFAFVLPFFVLSTSATEPLKPVLPPSVSAKSAVLIEAESGTVIYQKNADARLPMASTTKIMTALVALESGAPDQIISVPACAVGTEGSSVYLVEGEELTLEQLLYALLLESANDAAVTIAMGLAGSVDAFCERMNQKAVALGLTNTHFTNPHGLDDDEHYTTANELAIIAQTAMQNELFCTMVATKKTTIPHAGIDGVRLLINHNKLLRLKEDCIGIKTGYTSQSGRCLVSAAKRNGVTVIAVTLDAPNDWADHLSMFEYGFSKFESVSLCKPEDFRIPLSVVGGTDTYTLLCNREALQKVLPAKHGEIRTVIELRQFEYAPIAPDTALGRVVFYCDVDGNGIEEVLGSVSLVSAYGIEQVKVKKSFWQWLCSLFGF